MHGREPETGPLKQDPFTEVAVHRRQRYGGRSPSSAVSENPYMKDNQLREQIHFEDTDEEWHLHIAA